MFIAITVVAIILYFTVMAIKFAKYKMAVKKAVQLPRFYKGVKHAASHHILILGDSTMYGAGVKQHQLTIGGLFATKYPGATIEILAVNGARVKDLSGQLAQAKYNHYDLIVIGVGGNDIIRMSNYAEAGAQLHVLLRSVTAITDQIVLTHSVNVGNVGFFLFPFNLLFDYRTWQLSELYKIIASSFNNVVYVNFYRPRHDDHYTKQTRPLFLADDGLHANEFANQYFFDIIWDELQKQTSK